jgi:hypothetical protein
MTLSDTQSCLYFASSLVRAPHHQSFTCGSHSLSPHHRATAIVSLRNDNHGDELTDPLLLPKQLADVGDA